MTTGTQNNQFFVHSVIPVKRFYSSLSGLSDITSFYRLPEG
jgi:hypothetical protein